MTKFKLFYWKGVNALQQKQQGWIVALNSKMAQQDLFRRGIQSIKLQRHWRLSYQPKAKEVMELLMQLATLLQSALPLKTCLQILHQNCINLPLNQWLSYLLQDLENGLSFSQAIEKQNKYLTQQEIQLIKVGEMTGQFAEVCTQIAQARQQALALQRKVQKILLYPLFILAISLSLTLLLLLFIVPQFAEMYASNNNELPMITALLMTLSNGLNEHFSTFFIVLALSIVVIRWKGTKTVFYQRVKQFLIDHTPLLNQISQQDRLIRFTGSLHIMLQAGVPLQQALQAFLPQTKTWQKHAVADDVLTTEVRSILQGISKGYRFSESLSANIFPQQAQQMLQVGEQSGQLAMMLQHIAQSYQQQLDHKIDLLSQLLEPLLMLIIGGIIGLIMLGMYLPIFNMGSIIQ